MSKQELCFKYGFSLTTLASLLNDRYFDQLEPLGYRKNDKILSPKVLAKFFDLYGEPFKNENNDL